MPPSPAGTSSCLSPSVDGSDQRKHIQDMRELRRLWWEKLSPDERKASSADLATVTGDWPGQAAPDVDTL